MYMQMNRCSRLLTNPSEEEGGHLRATENIWLNHRPCHYNDSRSHHCAIYSLFAYLQTSGRDLVVTSSRSPRRALSSDDVLRIATTQNGSLYHLANNCDRSLDTLDTEVIYNLQVLVQGQVAIVRLAWVMRSIQLPTGCS